MTVLLDECYSCTKLGIICILTLCASETAFLKLCFVYMYYHFWEISSHQNRENISLSLFNKIFLILKWRNFISDKLWHIYLCGSKFYIFSLDVSSEFQFGVAKCLTGYLCISHWSFKSTSPSPMWKSCFFTQALPYLPGLYIPFSLGPPVVEI